MGDALVEIGKRFQRPRWARLFYRASERKLFDDIELMRKTADQVVKVRRANPQGGRRKDLLTAMIDAADLRTGKKLSDESITNNLITFLIAGHETTAGTLSFAFYSLLKNPVAYQTAQKEVDEVMGRDPVTIDKIFKLKYIPGVLRETLRHCAPIPGFYLEPLEDTLLGEAYPVKKGEAIIAYLTKTHLDPAVFGEDANQFKPERMTDANFDRLQKEFPNCWKPFGNGMRACIGRPFAWQEMLLAMSVLLQNFHFYMDDPSYDLRIMETLTIKPKDFYMRASLRHGMTAIDLERRLRGAGGLDKSNEGPEEASAQRFDGPKGASLSILYGSNSGTCKALAHRLAVDAQAHGFSATRVDSLDAARDSLPTNQPVVIFTSSYEGHPPDNARHFVTWLETLVGRELGRVCYSVFGVGNREWGNTFHKVPKFIDEALAQHGAKRLAAAGFTDVSSRDPFTDFETWEDDLLWPALEKEYVISKPDNSAALHGPSVQVSVPRSSILRQDVREAIVTATRDLTPPGVPAKKHIEIKLPTGTSYCAGDYLAVLPMNPRVTVGRVFRRFQLSWDAVLTVQGDQCTPLPTDQPTSAWDVLTAYVELAQPATRRNVLTLAGYAREAGEKERLEQLAGDQFQHEITEKRVSVLDLLEKYPSVELPIGLFLGLLPPMRIRQYSISSSPLKDPHCVSLSYSLLDEPSLSGQGRHIGVATSYIANLSPNERLHVAVRPSHVAFHLPQTPESTPIICIAAGSGIAPFRGFIQERAVQLAAGRALAPALLFYGCRGRADNFYREEFDQWEKEGAVTVKRAYSRETASEEVVGCKYVQDRLAKEKDELSELWNKGAKLFVCGGRRVGTAVEKACIELIKDSVVGDDPKRFLEESATSALSWTFLIKTIVGGSQYNYGYETCQILHNLVV
ncbi:uncharacterized protein CDV56_105806 [Aspergillus thermomutatus]|uniref:NADPH--cytochrome P450 reductase n=1 Tax=Aspergillus thermomutatus TaxID=41047 RepID=A0A397HH62_ASPTH|nr:uncharacterized protein CDV56_105806 [Aspergillus thermomutatus]RHZ59800.1 hypothetical protein CDV56_105806 [Aspergillus thermomutatus]